MTADLSSVGIMHVSTKQVIGSESVDSSDTLSVEEPLEIRLTAEFGGRRACRVIAVTMRTPGNDGDLALGFLFTEGIVSRADEIEDVCLERNNVVEVTLRRGVAVDPSLVERHSFIASSCGICGKRSIAAVWVHRNYTITAGKPRLIPELIHTLPVALRSAQPEFNRTGGIHAAALFHATGELLRVEEDVGRHNALDKLIGAEFRAESLPLEQRIIVVSGRASFELVQKAAQAGAPVLAAIGAPSSLALQLAEQCGITLLGFVRENRFNVYSCPDRLVH